MRVVSMADIKKVKSSKDVTKMKNDIAEIKKLLTGLSKK